jgi:multisubunit Na+/H+ antiporter MnhC subunit
MRRQNALVLASILVIFAIGFYVHTRNTDVQAPLAFCVIAAALITFFWFLPGSTGKGVGSPSEEGVLRRAIAASLVVEYLVLVGTFAFWGGTTESLAPMTQQLVTSFTTIVGVVIAFYFGASAYVEGKARARDAASVSAPRETEKLQSAQGPATESSQTTRT